MPQFSGEGVAVQRGVLILFTRAEDAGGRIAFAMSCRQLSDALDSRDDDSHDGKHVGYRYSVAMGQNHKGMSLERPIGKGPDMGE